MYTSDSCRVEKVTWTLRYQHTYPQRVERPTNKTSGEMADGLWLLFSNHLPIRGGRRKIARGSEREVDERSWPVMNKTITITRNRQSSGKNDSHVRVCVCFFLFFSCATDFGASNVEENIEQKKKSLRMVLLSLGAPDRAVELVTKHKWSPRSLLQWKLAQT